MKILIVSATSLEIQPLLDQFSHVQKLSDVLTCAVYKNHHLDILITGIGMVPTAFHVSKQLTATTYHLAINIGIAGSFKKCFPVGSVLNVVKDNFSELGLELNDEIIAIKNMNIQQKISNEFWFRGSLADDLPIVSGITVNTVHSNERTINNLIEKFNPDIETMESASFLYACQVEKLPCIEIRAISNFVKEREMAEWNSDLAIKNLNDFLSVLLHTLPIH